MQIHTHKQSGRQADMHAPTHTHKYAKLPPPTAVHFHIPPYLLFMPRTVRVMACNGFLYEVHWKLNELSIFIIYYSVLKVLPH